jgi:uncharacterized protein YpmS
MKWKILFFSLLAVNIMIISIVLFFVFQPVKKIDQMELPKEKEGAELKVQSSKEHLNLIINDYIAKKTKNHRLQYQILLTDRVELLSKIPLFGREVDFLVSFLPNVDKDGNVELTNPEMALGELRLPVSYVLKYLQKNASLPEEVTIEPGENRIYIHLNQLTLPNGYQIRAEKIDLTNNEIAFTLIVPVQSK